MKNNSPLVIGNWKMNPPTLEKSQKLFVEIKKAVGSKNSKTAVVVAAPSVFISELARLTKKTPLKLGAQDAFYEVEGAHTGEISLSMLKSIGVTHVILGHSERRALGEGNDEIAKKVAAVLKSGSTAIVCLGEKVRDGHGDYFGFVEAQLKSLISLIKKENLSRLVLAYEPVWAIGTSKHATPEDVLEMKLFIQKILSDHFGRTAVSKVRIVYGGSVNKENTESLLVGGQVNGFLVGGSSLKAAEFGAIVSITNGHA